jgi:hypothetical protein
MILDSKSQHVIKACNQNSVKIADIWLNQNQNHPVTYMTPFMIHTMVSHSRQNIILLKHLKRIIQFRVETCEKIFVA